MRIAIVDTYYSKFIEDLYSREKQLKGATYKTQLEILYAQLFGTANFYSYNLSQQGHHACDFLMNVGPLQEQWAAENRLWSAKRRAKSKLQDLLGRKSIFLSSGDLELIFAAQVQSFDPQVIHFQDPRMLTRQLAESFHAQKRVLTAQIASPFDWNDSDFSHFDLILSSFPHFVSRFRSKGIRSEYFQLGFESSIPKQFERVPRTRGAVFIGGLSRDHMERVHFLEELAGRVEFEWWGYGTEILDATSKLRGYWKGPAWGRGMYQILAECRISINHHIDASQSYANNMRLYESTGMNTLLLTDAKENLAGIFQPDSECVAYRDVAECADKIRYYLAHEAEREAIATRGHSRALQDHSYHKRMREFVAILSDKFPQLNRQ